MPVQEQLALELFQVWVFLREQAQAVVRARAELSLIQEQAVAEVG